MDDERADPLTTFFDDPENVDLYAVLNLSSTPPPTASDIKSAYRKLALKFHPDKHANASEKVKSASARSFQQVGFAYAVLSDETRRARYDSTGRTDEGLDGMGDREGGWEAYFEEIFEKVTKEKLDEMKKAYQGSEEELSDLREAYISSSGSVTSILSQIPHSNHTDEERFISILNPLIAAKDIPSFLHWDHDIRDKKGREKRRKAGEKEAKAAEESAKELGVWDEFYGDGKVTSKEERKAARKGKGKSNETEEADEEVDEGALKALIQHRAKARGDALFDSLAAKYGGGDAPSANSKRKSKGKRTEEEDDDDAESVSPKKKRRSNTGSAIPPPPDIDDAAFEALQAKLFGDKDKSGAKGSGGGKKASGSRASARKAKN